jgi:hypothetical protein
VARLAFDLRRNADGTITVRRGSYVEHFDVRDKGMLETYEAIRWGLVTANVPTSPAMLEDLFREVKGLKDPPPKVPAGKHGTVDGYTRFGCRCRRCRKARREYDRARSATERSQK